MSRAVIHYNPSLPHQVRHAEAFEAAGIEATPDINAAADIHIVSGPYYALPQWKGHKNLIMIDRAFYGDPEYVQMFWLNPDGTRTHATGTEPRYKPELQPWKKWIPGECRALILPDFQQDITPMLEWIEGRFDHITVRRHPAESGLKSGEQPDVSLADQIAEHDVCIGHSSTALFEAVVAGLPTICTDPTSVVAEVSQTDIEGCLRRPDRTDWLHRVSYMQWNHDEFGTALDMLKSERNIQ